MKSVSDISRHYVNGSIPLVTAYRTASKQIPMLNKSALSPTAQCACIPRRELWITGQGSIPFPQ